MSADQDTFDVVVVGAGLAGLTAALTAAEAGASVALLEKGAEYGGSSSRSGGGMVFVCTDLQQQAGVEDSLDALRDDLMRASQGRAQPEVIDAYVDNQLDTYRWMAGRGVRFTLEDASTATTVPRAHLTGPGVAPRHLHEQVMTDGRIAYLPTTAGRRLVRRDHGRVEGIEVFDGTAERTITARRGIVLASGGFGRSVELLRRFAPQWVDAVKMAGPHNTGDGITMAWALGAGVTDMPYVTASFGASIAHYPDLTLDPEEVPILLYPNYLGGIIVNLEGRRFANESLNYKILSRICADQPGGAAVQVFDERIFQQSDDRAVPWDFQAAYDAGLVVKADSIRELAVALDLDPDVLDATVADYNAAVRAGSDPLFGRPIGAGDKLESDEIASPPFYGFPTRSGLTSTYAGLTVDGDMRVIDVFGEPIAGLFAAGETVGGFHGAGYYSGSALGKAAVFGRVAGLNVVAGSSPAGG